MSLINRLTRLEAATPAADAPPSEERRAEIAAPFLSQLQAIRDKGAELGKTPAGINEALEAQRAEWRAALKARMTQLDAEQQGWRWR